MTEVVVVVEARALVRNGLVTALRALGHNAVGITRADELCFDPSQRSIVVFDESRAGSSVVDLTERVAAEQADVRIVVVSDRPNGVCTDRAVELVDRGHGVDGIARAISETQSAPAPAEARHQSPVLGLTGVERSVLRLIAQGATAREAGAALGISHRTVENHKRRIFTSLGASSQAQAVALAIRAGELRVLESAS